MNAFVEVSWLLIAGIASAVALTFIFFLSAIVVLVKRCNNMQRTLDRLSNNVSVLTSGSVGMGKKILVLEEKYRSLREKFDEIKESELAFSYTQAEKLIQQGIDDQSIAANSGLSTTEINLMRLLKGQSDLLQEEYEGA